MRVSARHGKASASKAWPPGVALRIVALFELLLSLTLAAAPSADASAGAFIKAYGWGVADGAIKFETLTTTCQAGIGGSVAGRLDEPEGVATHSSGDVYSHPSTLPELLVPGAQGDPHGGAEGPRRGGRGARDRRQRADHQPQQAEYADALVLLSARRPNMLHQRARRRHHNAERAPVDLEAPLRQAVVEPNRRFLDKRRERLNPERDPT